MTGNSSPLFYHDDSDSTVSLTSTQPEELLSEYAVEDILAEDVRDDGEAIYLVKWAGYPLYEATWEPRDSFPNSVSINIWGEHKESIAAGEKAAFDVAAWEQLCRDEDRKREKRRKRRAEKRRAQKSHASAEGPSRPKKRKLMSKAELLGTSPNKRSKQQGEPKSAARSQSKPATSGEPLDTTSDSELSIDDSQNTQYDLFNEVEDGEVTSVPTPTVRRVTSAARPLPRTTTTAESATINPRVIRPGPVQTTAKRSSGAPGAKRPVTSMFLTSSAPRKPQNRPSMPVISDPTETRLYKHLQTQYRNNHRGEQIPNVEDLNFIDPRTGKAAGNSSTVATERERTVVQAADTYRTPHPPSNARSHRVEDDDEIRQLRLDSSGVTCRRWLKTYCALGAACKYEHHLCTKIQAKTPAVCKHWLSGNCKFSSNMCGFYHIDPNDHPGLPFSTTGADDLETIKEYLRNSPRTKIPKREITCRRWLKGKCLRSDVNCGRAHKRCDIIEPKQNKTCPHWQYSHCQWTDAECSFYHQELDHTGQPTKRMIFETCPAWKTGDCNSGADCRYFHAYFDQRPNGSRHVPSRPAIQTGKSRLLAEEDQDYQDIDSMVLDDTTVFHNFHNPTLDKRTEVPSTDEGMAKLSLSDGTVTRSGDLSTRGESPKEKPSTPHDKSSTSSGNAIVALCEQYLNLNGERLFAGANRKALDKVVYCIFPRYVMEEYTLVLRFLEAIGATVLTADSPDAWSSFINCRHHLQKTHSGVVLYHPDIWNYWELRNYRFVLSMNFNHFQIGFDSTLLDHPSAARQYSCIRLFPSGTELVLVTDDVLVNDPSGAIELIDLFRRNVGHITSDTPEGCLVFRPGIKQFLLQTMDKVDDLQKARVALFILVDELLEAEPKSEFGVMMTPKSIISIPTEDAPDHAALWKTDPGAADEWLVNWFAGWCILQRERFGRFIIIASLKDRQRYERYMKYQHVAVWAPEKYLERRTRKENANKATRKK